MVTEHREAERKFVVPDGGVAAAFAALAEVAALSDPATTELTSTYYDTQGRHLARHNVTLRRRDGTGEQGWQLKIPAVEKHVRVEQQVPLGEDGDDDAVPQELQDRVRAYARREALEPVVTIQTDRTERHLTRDGRDLAVVAFDQVRARRPGPADVELVAWQELEVELVEGDDDVLEACTAALQGAGCQLSPHRSKLHQAIAVEPEADTDRGGDAAGAVVLGHLRDQVTELLRRDAEARHDEPEGIHKMRVATRRLRSALATFRPLLDREQTDPLRDELRWLGACLGAPRDTEVLRERLTAAAQALPVELRVGPVLDRISTELSRRHREAHSRLVDELDSERYLTLLDDLDHLLAEPPLTDRAQRPARKELRRLVHAAARRVERRAERADAATGAERDETLHEVRKAAKRARYAAEATEVVLGKPATKQAAAMEAVQELLGEVQDSVASRDLLRELAMVAHLAHENAFTYGVLHGRQALAAHEALDDYPRRRRRARKASL